MSNDAYAVPVRGRPVTRALAPTSWGAILVGVALTLVALLVLNLLGVGTGLAALDPTELSGEGAARLSLVAAAILVGSTIVAAFLGGVGAGRLSAATRRSVAGWHGLAAWAVTALILVYLVGSTVTGAVGGTVSAASGIVAGSGSALGSVAQTALQVAAPRLPSPGDAFAGVESAIRDSGSDPQALRDAAIAAVKAAVTGDPSQADAARARAADALARAQNISPDEAKAKLATYEQQYRDAMQQAGEKAKAAASATARATSVASLALAAALILGGLAGMLGGRMGFRETEIV